MMNIRQENQLMTVNISLAMSQDVWINSNCVMCQLNDSAFFSAKLLVSTTGNTVGISSFGNSLQATELIRHKRVGNSR